jgi:hypothetical protein
MFVTRDRLPHDAAVSCRPVTPAVFFPATSSEFFPADSTPEQCKTDALCFDNDTKPSCRKPLVLISIQNPQGCTPPKTMLFIFNDLKTARRRDASVAELDRLAQLPSSEPAKLAQHCGTQAREHLVAPRSVSIVRSAPARWSLSRNGEPPRLRPDRSFPASQHLSLRTTNIIQRMPQEFRRRIETQAALRRCGLYLQPASSIGILCAAAEHGE